MEEKPVRHYYGDQIRILFMFAGVLLVVTFPFFSELFHLPILIPLIAILTLAVLGGFLNPVHKWIIYIDTLVASVAFLSCEYYAVNTYVRGVFEISQNVYFFWLNQILALFFFFAVYLCIKTLRGKILNPNNP
ncbi:MAG: hypothetical protein V4439_02450 [Patescibacteria group bacterium]